MYDDVYYKILKMKYENILCIVLNKAEMRLSGYGRGWQTMTVCSLAEGAEGKGKARAEWLPVL